MKYQVFNRKFHYWAAFGIAIPTLIIICSGIVLQLKKQSAWIQPPEQTGSMGGPVISFDQVLEICRSIPEAEIASWDDINRVDVRPSRGMLKVWAKSSWEIQIDSKTGRVLQVAYRRSDLIESIHDGSWFHDSVKLSVFLPAGIMLLLLWLTGMYLFILPYYVRWRRKLKKSRVRSRDS